MDKIQMLSGNELVARGITKHDANLPALGLKDVTPNKSWLEQKQIQSALEARKHLIEVERIQKNGALSHAEWREDLMLAEVTKMAGGHWKYLGHHVGKLLFLNPEEALFLMEVNCLKLTYNEVIVSLQQAYSLLLRTNISLIQYKVYASLSRVGYKVFRHENKKVIDNEKKTDITEDNKMVIKNEELENVEMVEKVADESKENKMEVDCSTHKVLDNESVIDNTNVKTSLENGDNNEASKLVLEDKIQCQEGTMDIDKGVIEIAEEVSSTTKADESEDKLQNSNEPVIRLDAQEKDKHTINNSEDVSELKQTEPCTLEQNSFESITLIHQKHKLQMLENRKLRPLDAKVTEKCFEKIPDLYQKQVITVGPPAEEYLPRNVFLNNISYEINLESISRHSRYDRPHSSICNDEVNGEHIKRIKSASGLNSPVNNQTPPFQQNRPNFIFNRPNFMSWRPFLPNNFMFQRPFFMPYLSFNPRFRFNLPRPHFMPGLYTRFNSFQPNEQESVTNSNKKRKRDNLMQKHLDAIKHLAGRIRHLVQVRHLQTENINALQRLINTFNTEYHTKIRLDEKFNVIEDDDVVETITLDEDVPSPKKAKTVDTSQYKKHFNALKQLALKLKGLTSIEEATSQHRRAFSKLIRRFNKAYDADVYLNAKFEIIDKKFINLDSSSDSDCVIEDAPLNKKTKKLKNPFNILKRLSNKQKFGPSFNSKDGQCTSKLSDNTYSSSVTEHFDKNWLPNENDFGRAEVLPKALMNSYLLGSKREEFLFEFLKSHPYEYENWVEIKISFLKSVQETTTMLDNDMQGTPIDSLVGPGDCKDIQSILKKISIIKTNTDIDTESSLSIDFDVYNRDVQNFKKSNRPKPHFRVICVSESSRFPSGRDVSSLLSKYEDNISIVFAIVDLASVSYLQINPINLPVYVPNNDAS